MTKHINGKTTHYLTWDRSAEENRDGAQGRGGNCTVYSFVILSGRSSQIVRDGSDMWHSWDPREKHTKLQSENLTVRENMGIFKHRWENNINTDLKKTRYEYIDWNHVPETGIRAGCCESGNEHSSSA